MQEIIVATCAGYFSLRQSLHDCGFTVNLFSKLWIIRGPL